MVKEEQFEKVVSRNEKYDIFLNLLSFMIVIVWLSWAVHDISFPIIVSVISLIMIITIYFASRNVYWRKMK